MHFQSILDKMGCSNARLREIFTAPRKPETPPEVALDHIEPQKRPKTDSEIRLRIESRIRSRMLDGFATNAKGSRPMQAVDLAWDSPPIQKHSIPLMLWASGKIKIEETYKMLEKEVGASTASRFFKKEKIEGKEIMSLDMVHICDISIDIVKSYVTRRHAAMDSLWSQLWPLFKFDPRGTDDLSEFRADVLTQRVDIMAEDYNYRHFRSQCIRQMLLYNFSVAFPRSAWDRVIKWRPGRTNTGEPTEEIKSYIEREGIDFVNPHPSRIYYDASAPLPNINTDTGPRWIGYWDIVRYGSLLEMDSQYFNLNEVFCSNGWTDLVNQYSTFLNSYFDPTILKFPDASSADPSIWNDQKVMVGKYVSEAPDQGILLSQHFEKLNPLAEGIGTYNTDVWVRFTCAGDGTVIGAEFMPSIPGCYGGINVNDGRFFNQSMAMQLLAFQDQVSNIVTHMIQQIRASMVQLVLLDKDALPEEMVKDLQDDVKNKRWLQEPHVLTYSSSKLRETGFNDPKQAFVIISNQITNSVDAGLKALGELLNLADRLLVLSPNEQGQPNPREVSAREVNEVSTSVQSIYSFINAGSREQVGAMKRLIFESLITNAEENIRVPVEKRYTRDIIKRAGFKIPDDLESPKTDPKAGADVPDDDLVPSKTPVMGNLRDLNYDYYFDSRDGSERQVNAQGAQSVVQLLDLILKMPGLPQKLGLAGLMDAANLVIRMSGAPWNFQFDIPVGQGDAIPNPSQADPAAQMAQVMQVLQQLGGGVQAIEHVLMTQFHVSPKAFGIQPGPPGPPGAGAHPALHPAHPSMAQPGPAPAPQIPRPAGAPAPQAAAPHPAAAPASGPSPGTLAEPQ